MQTTRTSWFRIRTSVGVEKWLRLVLKDAFVNRWDSANAQTTRTNWFRIRTSVGVEKTGEARATKTRL